MEIKKFENSLIAFDFESEFVNTTDMGKKYNKRPIDFLRLDSTKAFINALESEVSQDHIIGFEAVKTIRGKFSDGRSQGTWMHKTLALKFAAWLEPKLEVFVYMTFEKVIKEKLLGQQRQLDYFWDKEDINDLYKRK